MKSKLRYRLHELLHPIAYLKLELTARAKAERKIVDCAERLFMYVGWALLEDSEEAFKDYANEIETYFWLLDGIFFRFGKKPSYKTFYKLLYIPHETDSANETKITMFYKKFCRALSSEKLSPNDFVLNLLNIVRK